MSDVWIVLIQDRHADVDALPFSNGDHALSAAIALAEKNAGSRDNVQWDAGLTPGMIRDGWTLYLPYGPEGDSVRVLRRTVDGGDGTRG